MAIPSHSTCEVVLCSSDSAVMAIERHLFDLLLVVGVIVHFDTEDAVLKR